MNLVAFLAKTYEIFYQRVQVLQTEELNYVNGSCKKNINKNFIKFILATVETTFARKGMNSFPNNHIWTV